MGLSQQYIGQVKHCSEKNRLRKRTLVTHYVGIPLDSVRRLRSGRWSDGKKDSQLTSQVITAVSNLMLYHNTCAVKMYYFDSPTYFIESSFYTTVKKMQSFNYPVYSVDIDWLEFQLKEGFLRNICQEVPGGCKRVCCASALSGLTSLLSDLKRFRLIFNFSSMSLPCYLKASFHKNAHTVLWIQPLTDPCYTLCIKKKEQTDKKMKQIFRMHC